MPNKPAAPPFYLTYGEPSREIDPRFVLAENTSDRIFFHHNDIKPHRHDQTHQIGLWRSGGGVHFFDEQSVQFRAPALTIMPAGVVHGFQVTPDSDAVVINIADGFLRDAAGSSQALMGVVDEALLQALDAEAMAAHRFDLHFEAIRQEQACAAADHLEAMAGHLKLILIGAARIKASLNRESGSVEAGLLPRFRRQLELHFQDDWTVARYVEDLGTTAYLLNVAVRAAFGHGVQAQIHARRIIEAKRLLIYSARSVGEIAYAAGFSDAAYFSRFFRAQTGESPQEWRRRKQGVAAG